MHGLLVLASTDEWAIPLNTLLLVILALTNYHIARKSTESNKSIGDVKRKIGLNRRHSDNPDIRIRDSGERRRASDRHHGHHQQTERRRASD